MSGTSGKTHQLLPTRLFGTSLFSPEQMLITSPFTPLPSTLNQRQHRGSDKATKNTKDRTIVQIPQNTKDKLKRWL